VAEAQESVKAATGALAPELRRRIDQSAARNSCSGSTIASRIPRWARVDRRRPQPHSGSDDCRGIAMRAGNAANLGCFAIARQSAAPR
jgi:hypothetical protein